LLQEARASSNSSISSRATRILLEADAKPTPKSTKKARKTSMGPVDKVAKIRKRKVFPHVALMVRSLEYWQEDGKELVPCLKLKPETITKEAIQNIQHEYRQQKLTQKIRKIHPFPQVLVKDNNDYVLILVACPGAVPADFIFQLKQQYLIIKVTPSYTISCF